MNFTRAKNKIKLIMRKAEPVFVMLLIFAIFYGCKSPTTTETQAGGEVVLKGQVLDKKTNNPIDSAVVRLLDYTTDVIQITDQNGRYEITITVDSVMELRVVAFKEGYNPDTVKVFAVPQRTVEVPPLLLELVTPVVETSGEAASIVLVDQSATTIGVKESGAPETAKLTFEVQDSSGVPVDISHSVEVSFAIGSGPGGGEFVYPQKMRTDNRGRVYVNVVSGTKAGVVQIVATAESKGKIIRSKPVAITIHGGLPDSAHFSVVPAKVNFPGYVQFGLRNKITAFVGDKYGNPVKPGTAVYFTTTGGIIQGSALTDKYGQASVDLISAAPLPVHPTLGPGFATVTATTVDENQKEIKAETIVLFSGAPVITINPSTIDIPNLGSQAFTYTVSDQNGNPLAEGSSITVTAEGQNLKLIGDTKVNIPDTQSKSWTRFGFTITDTDSSEAVRVVQVKISVTGPNGAAVLKISGVSR